VDVSRFEQRREHPGGRRQAYPLPRNAAFDLVQARETEQQTDIGVKMSLGLVVIIILILLLVGALPAWPHSRGWGYYPSGGAGLVLVTVLILLLVGRI
jgi:hypothetical protein